MAFFGVPHLGGPHIVYQQLRRGLADKGVEVRWIGLGPAAQQGFSRDAWGDELAHGEILAGDCFDEGTRGRILGEHLIASKYDGVFVNVLTDQVQTNVARFLPPDVTRIAIVHSITPGTYQAAGAIRDWVHAAVGVSPRIRTDLVQSVGYPPERTYAVCSACDVPAAPPLRQHADRAAPIKVLSLGRIEDRSKGTLWIPQILASLPHDAYELTIAGDGPDVAELKRRCTRLGVRANFVGSVPHDEAQRLLAGHDVFLMPSRYEGFGLTLVEAMVAGCVPIASRIRGVTDHIVRDGQDGRLFTIGNVTEAAQRLSELTQDRAVLQTMAASCRRRAEEEFSLEKMAESYLRVLNEAKDAPLARAPLPWDAWDYPRGLRPSLIGKLPSPVKNMLRGIWSRYA